MVLLMSLSMTLSIKFVLLELLLVSLSIPSYGVLQVGFYNGKCNTTNVEKIVSKVVKKHFIRDKFITAALIRMQFHDCFVHVRKYIYYAHVSFWWLHLFRYDLWCVQSLIYFVTFCKIIKKLIFWIYVSKLIYQNFTWWYSFVVMNNNLFTYFYAYALKINLECIVD